MPTVLDILTTKGTDVHRIGAEAAVLEAVHVMNEEKIGALIVMQGERVAGIFTERDVLRRVMAQELSPRNAKVGDVMTREVVCCSPETDIDDASRIMMEKRVRHLPICGEDGQLLGMISIGDLNAFHASHTEAHLQYLNEYVYGRA